MYSMRFRWSMAWGFYKNYKQTLDSTLLVIPANIPRTLLHLPIHPQALIVANVTGMDSVGSKEDDVNTDSFPIKVRRLIHAIVLMTFMMLNINYLICRY